MDENEYNKIARLYHFLQLGSIGRYFNSDFAGNYQSYSIEELHFDEDTWKIVNKFQDLSTLDFYDEDFLKKNGYPSLYYNQRLVQKSDKHIGFQNQLKHILLYYLLYNLKETANNFLQNIDSNEFESLFGEWIVRDKYVIKYPNEVDKRLHTYWEANVEGFSLVNHFFCQLSNISFVDGRLIGYRIERIKQCLQSLNDFNFNKASI